MIIFIPVDKNEKQKYLTEGIDINKCYNKVIGLAGIEIKCISGFLTNDIISGDFIAAKIDINKSYAANYDLWVAYTLTSNQEFNKMYIRSIVNLKKYMFGTFRIPEVLITESIPSQDLFEPMFNNSSKFIESKNDEIYINFLIEKITKDEKIANSVVIDYFNRLCETTQDFSKKIINKGDNKLYIFIQQNKWAWTIED
ncbi:hypothetical protein ACAG39_08310 [Caldicellulosiruptoraceae bacterium PP1]